MPAQPSHKPSGAAAEEPSERDPGELRADARRNRERILRAAREAFADLGIDAPMSAVARRAGVGAATLYRRFPTRAALVTAAFAEQLAVCAAALDEATADPDPGRGLYRLLDKVCTMQITERGFTSAFLAEFPDALDYDGARDRAESDLARLVRRAQESGRLRPDFDVSDITLLLLANNGLTGQPTETALAASRRLLAYVFPAFRAEGLGPLPAPAGMGLRYLHRPAGALTGSGCPA